MAFKIKFRTQIFFGITLFFFRFDEKYFSYIFFYLWWKHVNQWKPFPEVNKKHTKKKTKNKKQNKTKSKFTTTIVNCHQQNYHHCHFHCQHYHYHHSTYIKYQLLCYRSQKKNPLPFSRFQLNIEKKIIFSRKNNFHLNILRVCLISNFFTETENFLLKVLQIKVKVS